VPVARHVVGREAEDLAAGYVRAEGFTILWRNVRIGKLEVDLVARKDDLAVVVEVRTRGSGSFEKPLASVSRDKRRMLLRASRGLWRGRLSKMPGIERLRIDVIGVTRDDEGVHVEWIRGAITEQDA
jgi:putative endonuclease